MTPAEESLLKDVRALEGSLLDQARELVAIPTVNPFSGDSSAASEAPGQLWIEQRFRELGARVWRIPVPPDVYARGGVIGPGGGRWERRENVVAEWTLGDGRGPCVLLNDHMDTVGTDGMEIPPFDPVVKDGKLYGRGSSDTKGNIAMGLAAVEGLLRHAERLRGRIVFESVVDEECNGAGAGTLACCLAGVRGDVALCLDGSSGCIVNGCRGIATARVRVNGRAGHSSTKGSVSAIDKAIAVKEAVDDFGRAHVKTHPGCAVTLGIFRSGTLPAIVPGTAELQINMSYTLADAARAEADEGQWDGRLFRARFERAMSELPQRDSWFAEKPVEVGWIKDMYPFECDPRGDLFRLVTACDEEVSGQPAKVAPMTAWFDAAHLARCLRIPVAGIGRGTPGCAHGATEYVVLDDLYRGARTLALALFRLLSR